MIDASLRVVTCSHCGSLHDMPGGVGELPAGASASAGASATKTERSEVALPRRFKLQRSAASLEVIWPVGGLFHGLVLLIMAFAFAYAALTSGALPLLIASAGILYFGAVRAFNKHRVRADAASLQVMQGPLPWPGNRKLVASDIEQLYATERTSRSEAGGRGNRTMQVRKYYLLSANLRSRGRVTILSGLSDPHQALWLEQEIERLLGIDDKRVAGDYVV